MKKVTKKIAAMVLAATMLVGVGLTAMAAYPGTYEAKVYDPNSYGTENQDLAMGDDAVLNADLSYADGKTTITVYTQKMKAMGIFTGYVNEMTIKVGNETINGVSSTLNGADFPNVFTFVVDGDYSHGTQIFYATFKIKVGGFNHPTVDGDLVILGPDVETAR